MSEIYLTKIERKTIFTKSLIFVLIMFVISDLTVTGPFYFNFIPWMYIIGVVGSIKKIDSVLMSVIGTFTVFVASLIVQGGVNLSCVISTVITLVTLVLGIFTGKFIYEFILEHRLVKYIRHSKKVVYIISIIVMFLTSWLMVGLNSGNIVTYLKSRNNLKEYIEKTYNIKEFNVVKVQYVKDVPGKYIYRVEIENSHVSFVPVTYDTFKDTNKDSRLMNMQHDLELETVGKVQEVKNKYPLMEDVTIAFNLEYNSVAITPDTIVMNVKCNNVTDDEQELAKLYYELAECINELQTLKQVQKLTITIGDKTLQLANENIQNITPDYIKGGFEIEEISE